MSKTVRIIISEDNQWFHFLGTKLRFNNIWFKISTRSEGNNLLISVQEVLRKHDLGLKVDYILPLRLVDNTFTVEYIT